MELTAQELRDVEFRERWRGYDPDDVDDFLERAAVAVDELHGRLRDALDRAGAAEARITEGAQAEGALRHTLVLAQRTADNAVAEAQEKAAQILRDAEAQAQAVVADARRKADEAAEEAQRQLRVDLALLETARANLQADIEALEQYLAEERAHVRSSLTELMWRLEERVSGGLSPRPDQHDIVVPPPPGHERNGAPAAPSLEAPQHTAPAPRLARAPEPVAAVEPPPPGRPAPPRLVYKRAAGDDAMPGPVAPPLPSADVTAAAEDDKPLPADDAFFAALRSALDDDEPLGPREDAPVREAVAGVFDQDPGAADRSASRFRRRR